MKAKLENLIHDAYERFVGNTLLANYFLATIDAPVGALERLAAGMKHARRCRDELLASVDLLEDESKK